MLDRVLLKNIQNNLPELKVINLSFQKLSTEEVATLCNALTSNTKVHSLLLNGISMTDEGACHVLTLLQRNSHLKRVELARNPLISDTLLHKIQTDFGERFDREGIARLALNPYRNHQAVDEASALTSEQFKADYLSSGRPVVIRGAAQHSSAVQAWSPSYLKQKLKKTPVELAVHNTQNEAFEHYFFRIKFRELPFDEAVDTIEDSEKNSSLKAQHYLQQVPIDVLPEMKEELPAPLFAHEIEHTHQQVNLWYGQKEVISPLHFDFSHNIFMQIWGDKYITLYPPSESKYLSQCAPVAEQLLQPAHLSQLANTGVLDNAALLQKATSYHIHLKPGDVLFIPRAWWHEVTTGPQSSISLNYWFRDDRHAIAPVEEALKHVMEAEDKASVIRKCAEILLKRHKPNYVAQNEISILQLAIIFGVSDVVQSLLRHPQIDPNYTTDCFNFSPLYLAKKFERLDVHDALLKHTQMN